MNELTKLVKLVKSMRVAQNEYFKHKSYASLDKAKRLEREVDHEIKKFENPEMF